IFHFHLVEDRLLDLVFGRKTILDHGSALEVAHLRLNEAAKIAGRPVIDAEDRVQVVVVLDHHTWTHLCRCYHAALRLRMLRLRCGSETFIIAMRYVEIRSTAV